MESDCRPGKPHAALHVAGLVDFVSDGSAGSAKPFLIRVGSSEGEARALRIGCHPANSRLIPQQKP